MLNCPFCGTDFSQVKPRDGRCSECGGLLESKGTRGGSESTGSDATKQGPAGTQPTISLDASTSKHLDSIWKETLTPEVTPMMTLKSNQGTSLSGNTLVIPPRTLAREDDQDAVRSDYELLRVIGQGGVGVVYSARQASIDRTVAIKMLRPEIESDFENRRKFLSEAVVTGDLDHPNIVPVYELGADSRGELFYSMKQVQGTPWSKVIHETSLGENLSILLRVADAVAFSHARGVVHRDLKPENVMLGNFGEVLVMDWGIALSSSLFIKGGDVTQSASMGGTPAYMAPEMALGPLENIGPHSDVYLLGAILFEVMAGKAPHGGTTVIECLRAAARNEIQETEANGELMDVARKAMATEPSERYPDVLSFQDAIRAYQTHAESIRLADHAESDLEAARTLQDYQLFAKALFGFQQAKALWTENDRLADRERIAALEYARCAFHKSDFDLGRSLLTDERDPDHRVLRTKIEAGQRERDARRDRLNRLRRLATVLTLLILVVVTAFSIQLYYAARVAENARAQEEIAKNEALELKQEADGLRAQAESALEQEEAARISAVAARRDAERLQDLETQAKERARENALQALAEKRRAERAQREANQQAYLANIGRAQAKLSESAFTDAQRILAPYAQAPLRHLRHWEWGRLRFFDDLSEGTLSAAEAPIDVVAYSPDGKWLAVALRGGRVELRNLAHSDQVVPLDTRQEYVFDLDFSPDGKWLVTVGDRVDDAVQLWNVPQGTRHRMDFRSGDGHTDYVLGVAFSFRGNRRLLATCSFDKTAKIWDLESGRLLRTLEGHHGPVWDVAMSADQRWLVTVSEDGTAIVWRSPSSQGWAQREAVPFDVLPKFSGHEGPIYTVAFSPQNQVVTAGRDGRILVWDPVKLVQATPQRYRQLRQQDWSQTRYTTNENRRRRRRVEQADAMQNAALLNAIPRVDSDGHTAAIRHLVFSADGRRLFSSGDDNTIRAWDFASGDLVKVLRGHSRSVACCAVDPSSITGDRLVSGGHDQQVKFWSVSRYQEYQEVQQTILQGHEDAVLATAFDSTGNRVVTAGRDRTARVWPVSFSAPVTQPLQALREGHDFLTTAAQFFDDGRHLVTSAMDGTTRIWRVATGTQLVALPETGQSGQISLSADRRWLITGSREGGSKLWDLDAILQEPTTAKPRWLSPSSRRSAAVTATTFLTPRSPQEDDGSQRYLVCTADARGQATFWEIRVNGAEVKVQPIGNQRLHDDSVVSLMASPQLDVMVTASRDGTVRQWQTQSTSDGSAFRARELVERRMQHPAALLACCFVSDGKILATSCEDGAIRLWEVASGQPTRPEIRFANGSRRTIAGNARRLLRRQNRSNAALAQALGMSMTQVTSLLNGRTDVGREQLQTLARLLETTPESLATPRINALYPSTEGNRILATSSEDRSVFDWDVASEQLAVQRIDTDQEAREQSVWTAVFAPRETQILIVGGRTIRLFDLNANRTLLDFSPHSSVVAADFSLDGMYVATAGWDRAVRIWDLSTGLARSKLIGHQAAVNSVMFSWDGKEILTSSNDGTVRRWRTESGERIAVDVLYQHPNQPPIRGAVYSPRGQYLATVSDDRSARIWRTETGEVHQALRGHNDTVTCAAFSPDGRWLATGSRDQTVRVWEVSSGSQVGIVLGHTAQVLSVAFSHDGHRLISGSSDQTARLWDTTSLADRANGDRPITTLPEVMTLRGHRDDVTSVKFSPQGRWVLTGSRDGNAILWNADEIEPTVVLPNDELNYESGVGDRTVDPLASFVSPTRSDWANVALVCRLTDDPDAQPEPNAESVEVEPDDQVSILTSEEGTNAITIVDGDVRYVVDGHQLSVGAVTGGRNGQELKVQFREGTRAFMVDAVLKQLAYRNNRPVEMMRSRLLQVQIVDSVGEVITETETTIRLQPAER